MVGFGNWNLHHLQSLPPAEALGLFAGAMVLESLGAPVPSEVVLPAAGWWVQKASFAPVWVELLLTFAAVTAGSLLGCTIAYAIGYYGGRPLVTRFGRYLLITPHRLDRAEKWLQGKGAWSLAVSRLIVGVRALISYPVGATCMPLRRFLLFTLIGISLFDAALLLLGYRFGSKISDQLHHWGLESGIAAAVLVLLLIVISWWRHAHHPSP